MKLREDDVRVPALDCEIRSVVLAPIGEGPWPGVLLYTARWRQRAFVLVGHARRAGSILATASLVLPRDSNRVGRSNGTVQTECAHAATVDNERRIGGVDAVPTDRAGDAAVGAPGPTDE